MITHSSAAGILEKQGFRYIRYSIRADDHKRPPLFRPTLRGGTRDIYFWFYARRHLRRNVCHESSSGEWGQRLMNISSTAQIHLKCEKGNVDDLTFLFLPLHGTAVSVSSLIFIFVFILCYFLLFFFFFFFLPP